eukprot:jgi/Psemu1/282572/fgenesh1_pg.9_\
MSRTEDSAKQLSKAAAELVKAACDQTEGASLDIQREVAANILDLKEESVAFKSDMNNKLNTVNQNLQDTKNTMESLLTAINALNKAIKEEGKMNRLNAAFPRIDKLQTVNQHYGFVCNYDERGHYVGNSINYTNFIQDVISSFIKGNGYQIGRCGYMHGPGTHEEKLERFRKTLKDDIQSLTGTVPNIAKDVNGTWCIWYQ